MVACAINKFVRRNCRLESGSINKRDIYATRFVILPFPVQTKPANITGLGFTNCQG